MITVKQILKAIGCPHLNLYQGEGYWYFVYSNEAQGGNPYEDKSIPVLRLNHMSLDRWIEEGRELVQQAQEWESRNDS